MQEYINSLIKQVISKSPLELKAMLWQTACSSPDWTRFLRQAEEASWIAFPEQTSPLVCAIKERKEAFVKKRFPNKRNISVKKKEFCKFHGECQHSTDECFTIKKIKSL